MSVNSMLQVAFVNGDAPVDHCGWLNTRRKKSEPWQVKFFTLKGVYLTAMLGELKGNEDLRGPQKALPPGFQADYQWISKVGKSSTSMVGAKLKDDGELGFTVTKIRWTDHDLDIHLQAETEGDKVEWMRMIEQQLKRMKDGELKKPLREEVNLPVQKHGYNPATGSLDLDEARATAKEEMKYLEILFTRFLEDGANGIKVEGFQELLVSLGLGDELSDEELQDFVRSEFERADKSHTKQVEFEEFVAAYNHLIDLQKQKLDKTCFSDKASEMVGGVHPASVELVPQNATEWPMFSANWVKENEYTLHMKENFMSWSNDDFTCKDNDGKVVLRSEGKVWSAGSDVKGYDAETGEFLFHLEEIFFRVTKTYLLKDKMGRVVCTIRQKVFSFSPDIKVFSGAAEFDWRGRTANPILFKIDGDFFEWQFKVRNARGELVAFSDEKLRVTTFFGSNHYAVKIAPGMDVSLIAALMIACDCAVNDAN